MTVRAGQKDAEFVGQCDQFGFGTSALVAGFAVTSRCEERGLHTFGGTRAQQIGVGRRRSAHEHEVDRVIGKRCDVGDGLDTQDFFTLQVGAMDGSAISGRKDVVQGDETELPRMS